MADKKEVYNILQNQAQQEQDYINQNATNTPPTEYDDYDNLDESNIDDALNPNPQEKNTNQEPDSYDDSQLIDNIDSSLFEDTTSEETTPTESNISTPPPNKAQAIEEADKRLNTNFSIQNIGSSQIPTLEDTKRATEQVIGESAQNTNLKLAQEKVEQFRHQKEKMLGAKDVSFNKNVDTITATQFEQQKILAAYKQAGDFYNLDRRLIEQNARINKQIADFQSDLKFEGARQHFMLDMAKHSGFTPAQMSAMKYNFDRINHIIDYDSNDFLIRANKQKAINTLNNKYQKELMQMQTQIELNNWLNKRKFLDELKKAEHVNFDDSIIELYSDVMANNFMNMSVTHDYSKIRAEIGGVYNSINIGISNFLDGLKTFGYLFTPDEVRAKGMADIAREQMLDNRAISFFNTQEYLEAGNISGLFTYGGRVLLSSLPEMVPEITISLVSAGIGGVAMKGAMATSKVLRASYLAEEQLAKILAKGLTRSEILAASALTEGAKKAVLRAMAYRNIVNMGGFVALDTIYRSAWERQQKFNNLYQLYNGDYKRAFKESELEWSDYALMGIWSFGNLFSLELLLGNIANRYLGRTGLISALFNESVGRVGGKTLVGRILANTGASAIGEGFIEGVQGMIEELIENNHPELVKNIDLVGAFIENSLPGGIAGGAMGGATHTFSAVKHKAKDIKQDYKERANQKSMTSNLITPDTNTEIDISQQAENIRMKEFGELANKYEAKIGNLPDITNEDKATMKSNFSSIKDTIINLSQKANTLTHNLINSYSNIDRTINTFDRQIGDPINGDIAKRTRGEKTTHHRAFIDLYSTFLRTDPKARTQQQQTNVKKVQQLVDAQIHTQTKTGLIKSNTKDTIKSNDITNIDARIKALENSIKLFEENYSKIFEGKTNFNERETNAIFKYLSEKIALENIHSTMKDENGVIIGSPKEISARVARIHAVNRMLQQILGKEIGEKEITILQDENFKKKIQEIEELVDKKRENKSPLTIKEIEEGIQKIFPDFDFSTLEAMSNKEQQEIKEKINEVIEEEKEKEQKNKEVKAKRKRGRPKKSESKKSTTTNEEPTSTSTDEKELEEILDRIDEENEDFIKEDIQATSNLINSTPAENIFFNNPNVINRYSKKVLNFMKDVINTAKNYGPLKTLANINTKFKEFLKKPTFDQNNFKGEEVKVTTTNDQLAKLQTKKIEMWNSLSNTTKFFYVHILGKGNTISPKYVPIYILKLFKILDTRLVETAKDIQENKEISLDDMVTYITEFEKLCNTPLSQLMTTRIKKEYQDLSLVDISLTRKNPSYIATKLLAQAQFQKLKLGLDTLPTNYDAIAVDIEVSQELNKNKDTGSHEIQQETQREADLYEDILEKGSESIVNEQETAPISSVVTQKKTTKKTKAEQKAEEVTQGNRTIPNSDDITTHPIYQGYLKVKGSIFGKIKNAFKNKKPEEIERISQEYNEYVKFRQGHKNGNNTNFIMPKELWAYRKGYVKGYTEEELRALIKYSMLKNANTYNIILTTNDFKLLDQLITTDIQTDETNNILTNSSNAIYLCHNFWEPQISGSTKILLAMSLQSMFQSVMSFYIKNLSDQALINDLQATDFEILFSGVLQQLFGKNYELSQEAKDILDKFIEYNKARLQAINNNRKTPLTRRQRAEATLWAFFNKKMGEQEYIDVDGIKKTAYQVSYANLLTRIESTNVYKNYSSEIEAYENGISPNIQKEETPISKEEIQATNGELVAPQSKSEVVTPTLKITPVETTQPTKPVSKPASSNTTQPTSLKITPVKNEQTATSEPVIQQQAPVQQQPVANNQAQTPVEQINYGTAQKALNKFFETMNYQEYPTKEQLSKDLQNFLEQEFGVKVDIFESNNLLKIWNKFIVNHNLSFSESLTQPLHNFPLIFYSTNKKTGKIINKTFTYGTKEKPTSIRNILVSQINNRVNWALQNKAQANQQANQITNSNQGATITELTFPEDNLPNANTLLLNKTNNNQYDKSGKLISLDEVSSPNESSTGFIIENSLVDRLKNMGSKEDNIGDNNAFVNNALLKAQQIINKLSENKNAVQTSNIGTKVLTDLSILQNDIFIAIQEYANYDTTTEIPPNITQESINEKVTNYLNYIDAILNNENTPTNIKKIILEELHTTSNKLQENKYFLEIVGNYTKTSIIQDMKRDTDNPNPSLINKIISRFSYLTRALFRKILLVTNPTKRNALLQIYSDMNSRIFEKYKALYKDLYTNFNSINEKRESFQQIIINPLMTNDKVKGGLAYTATPIYINIDKLLELDNELSFLGVSDKAIQTTILELMMISNNPTYDSDRELSHFQGEQYAALFTQTEKEAIAKLTNNDSDLTNTDLNTLAKSIVRLTPLVKAIHLTAYKELLSQDQHKTETIYKMESIFDKNTNAYTKKLTSSKQILIDLRSFNENVFKSLVKGEEGSSLFSIPSTHISTILGLNSQRNINLFGGIADIALQSIEYPSQKNTPYYHKRNSSGKVIGIVSDLASIRPIKNVFLTNKEDGNFYIEDSSTTDNSKYLLVDPILLQKSSLSKKYQEMKRNEEEMKSFTPPMNQADYQKWLEKKKQKNTSKANQEIVQSAVPYTINPNAKDMLHQIYGITFNQDNSSVNRDITIITEAEYDRIKDTYEALANDKFDDFNNLKTEYSKAIDDFITTFKIPLENGVVYIQVNNKLAEGIKNYINFDGVNTTISRELDRNSLANFQNNAKFFLIGYFAILNNTAYKSESFAPIDFIKNQINNMPLDMHEEEGNAELETSNELLIRYLHTLNCNDTFYLTKWQGKSGRLYDDISGFSITNNKFLRGLFVNTSVNDNPNPKDTSRHINSESLNNKSPVQIEQKKLVNDKTDKNSKTKMSVREYSIAILSNILDTLNGVDLDKARKNITAVIDGQEQSITPEELAESILNRDESAKPFLESLEQNLTELDSPFLEYSALHEIKNYYDKKTDNIDLQRIFLKSDGKTTGFAGLVASLKELFKSGILSLVGIKDSVTGEINDTYNTIANRYESLANQPNAPLSVVLAARMIKEGVDARDFGKKPGTPLMYNAASHTGYKAVLTELLVPKLQSIFNNISLLKNGKYQNLEGDLTEEFFFDAIVNAGLAPLLDSNTKTIYQDGTIEFSGEKDILLDTLVRLAQQTNMTFQDLKNKPNIVAFKFNKLVSVLEQEDIAKATDFLTMPLFPLDFLKKYKNETDKYGQNIIDKSIEVIKNIGIFISNPTLDNKINKLNEASNTITDSNIMTLNIPKGNEEYKIRLNVEDKVWINDLIKAYKKNPLSNGDYLFSPFKKTREIIDFLNNIQQAVVTQMIIAKVMSNKELSEFMKKERVTPQEMQIYMDKLVHVTRQAIKDIYIQIAPKNININTIEATFNFTPFKEDISTKKRASQNNRLNMKTGVNSKSFTSSVEMFGFYVRTLEKEVGKFINLYQQNTSIYAMDFGVLEVPMLFGQFSESLGMSKIYEGLVNYIHGSMYDGIIVSANRVAQAVQVWNKTLQQWSKYDVVGDYMNQFLDKMVAITNGNPLKQPKGVSDSFYNPSISQLETARTQLETHLASLQAIKNDNDAVTRAYYFQNMQLKGINVTEFLQDDEKHHISIETKINTMIANTERALKSLNILLGQKFTQETNYQYTPISADMADTIISDEFTNKFSQKNTQEQVKYSTTSENTNVNEFDEISKNYLDDEDLEPQNPVQEQTTNDGTTFQFSDNQHIYDPNLRKRFSKSSQGNNVVFTDNTPESLFSDNAIEEVNGKIYSFPSDIYPAVSKALILDDIINNRELPPKVKLAVNKFLNKRHRGYGKTMLTEFNKLAEVIEKESSPVEATNTQTLGYSPDSNTLFDEEDFVDVSLNKQSKEFGKLAKEQTNENMKRSYNLLSNMLQRISNLGGLGLKINKAREDALIAAQLDGVTRHYREGAMTGRVFLGDKATNEVKAHEVYHLLLEYAKMKGAGDMEIDSLCRAISQVREIVYNRLEKLPTNERSKLLKEMNMTEAQYMYAMQSDSEFVSYFMTHENRMNYLSTIEIGANDMSNINSRADKEPTNLFGKLLYRLSKLVFSLFSRTDSRIQGETADVALYGLVSQLMEENISYLQANQIHNGISIAVQEDYRTEQIVEKMRMQSNAALDDVRRVRNYQKMYLNGTATNVFRGLSSLYRIPWSQEARDNFNLLISSVVHQFDMSHHSALRWVAKHTRNIALALQAPLITTDYSIKCMKQLDDIRALKNYAQATGEVLREQDRQQVMSLFKKYNVDHTDEVDKMFGDSMIVYRLFDMIRLRNMEDKSSLSINEDWTDFRSLLFGGYNLDIFNKLHKKVRDTIVSPYNELKFVSRDGSKEIPLNRYHQEKLYNLLINFAKNDITEAKVDGHNLTGFNNIETLLSEVAEHPEILGMSKDYVLDVNSIYTNKATSNLYEELKKLGAAYAMVQIFNRESKLTENERKNSPLEKLANFIKEEGSKQDLLARDLLLHAKSNENMKISQHLYKGDSRALYSEFHIPTRYNHNVDLRYADNAKSAEEWRKLGFTPMYYDMKTHRFEEYELEGSINDEVFKELIDKAYKIGNKSIRILMKRKSIAPYGKDNLEQRLVTNFSSKGVKLADFYDDITHEDYQAQLADIYQKRRQILDVYTKDSNLSLESRRDLERYRTSFQLSGNKNFVEARHLMNKHTQIALYEGDTKFSSLTGQNIYTGQINKHNYEVQRMLLDSIIESSLAVKNLERTQPHLKYSTRVVLTEDPDEKADISREALLSIVGLEGEAYLKEQMGKNYLDRLVMDANVLHILTQDTKFGLHNILGETGRKILPLVYKSLAYISAGLSKIISEMKATQIIRNEKVVMINATSNIVTLLAYECSPKEIMYNHARAIEGLHQTAQKQKELFTLRSQLNQIQNKNSINAQKLIRRVKWLQNEIDNSLTTKLLRSGFYSNIVEDSHTQHLDINIINKTLDRFGLKGEARNVAYLGLSLGIFTSDSPIYKVQAFINGVSDYAAKYTLYQHYRQEMSEEKAITLANDSYINYNRPNMVPLMRFLEHTGMSRYLKYHLGMQGALIKAMFRNPIRAGGLFLASLFILPKNITMFDTLGEIYTGSMWEQFRNWTFNPLNPLHRW